LQLATVELGVDVAKLALLGLREDELIYGELEAAIDFKRRKLLRTLYSDMMPLHARRLAFEAREFLRTSENKIKFAELDPTIRPYLNALIGKYKALLDEDLDSAQELVKDPNSYIGERKRLSKLLLKRNSHKFSDRCLELGKRVLEHTENSLEIEADYKALWSSCHEK
jgi:hypothetical protein